MGGHSVLATKTLNGSILVLAYHKDYASSGYIPWKTTTSVVSAIATISSIEIQIISLYFPHTGYDHDQP
eukprot:1690563-Amphidinium_carterae.1